MTIIYMKLKYCGYAFRLFSRIITDAYCENQHLPEARLFAQFHAPAMTIVGHSLLITLAIPIGCLLFTA